MAIYDPNRYATDNNGVTSAYNSVYDPNNPYYDAQAISQSEAPLVGGGVAANLAHQEEANLRNIASRNAATIKLPEFSGQYELAGMLDPQMYADPVMAEAFTANESPEGRMAQLAALGRLQQDSDQSVASQQALDRYQAMQDAEQMANSREGAIRMDAMRRGQIGGPADMIMRAQAAQAGANRNLNAGLQAAQMAALQRLQGTQAVGGLAGQMRGQDQATAFRNQQAINDFNQFNTGALNKTRMGNVDVRNVANAANIAAKQGIMNKNIERGDTNAMNTFNASANRIAAINAPLVTGANAVPGMLNASTKATGEDFDQLKGVIGGVGGFVGGLGELVKKNK